MEIKLLKLYRHGMYLENPKRVGTSSLRGEEISINSWWESATQEFKDTLFKKRKEDSNIDAVVQIIAQLPDVTIFCHSFTLETGAFSNPQVVPNEDIIEIKDLIMIEDEPKQGNMVYVEWEDATVNYTPASIEEVSTSDGLAQASQLGFLMHQNERRVFIGGRHNHTIDKYRQLEAIPTGNILKMVKLQIK